MQIDSSVRSEYWSFVETTLEKIIFNYLKIICMDNFIRKLFKTIKLLMIFSVFDIRFIYVIFGCRTSIGMIIFRWDASTSYFRLTTPDDATDDHALPDIEAADHPALQVTIALCCGCVPTVGSTIPQLFNIRFCG